MKRAALTLGSLLIACGMAAPAAADEFLGSGVTFGGDNQRILTCWFSNVGISSRTLKNAQIFNFVGFAQGLRVNSCGNLSSFALGAGQSCLISINMAAQNVYGCKVTVGSKGAVRGTLQVYDVNGNLVQAQQLQ